MPPNANSANIEVKICGLASPESVDVAVEGGARYVGFVFYPPSPRNLKPAEARSLTERVPLGVHRVALFVNPSDTDIDRVFAQNQFDMIQLHGAETPERTNNIRARTGTKVMKVIKLAARADLAAAAAYQGAADQLLFDAMAPKDRTDALPGGNALAFDWELLRDADIPLPWMLAGGLDAENLAEAVSISGASELDVSSGVESAPGIKDLKLIKDFLSAAKG